MRRDLWMKVWLCVLCAFTFNAAGFSQDKPSNPVPEAKPADVASIDSIVAAVYDVISGPAGQKRDWDRFRSLFAPGARLIPVAQAGETRAARVLSVDDYIARSSPILEKSGFYERETARRLEAFGDIAHRFSTYESRRKADDPAPFVRGINSFQLMNDGKRWWIVTIFWEAEGPDRPIPPEFLK
jgi:hypothetical protein